MNAWIFLPLSYLMGATPTSLWVGQAVYGVDLRTRGSGNLGATNTFRVLGWKAALPVMIVDVAKGWAPAFFFPGMIDPTSTDVSATVWMLAFGAAAIVGHVFSVWVRFRGGKGVATSAGVLLAVAPLSVVVGLVVWLLAVFTTRIVSLGSILAALAVPAASHVLPGGPEAPVRIFLWLVAAFVIFAHRSNIGRLLRGEEARFRGRSEPGPADGLAGGADR